MRSYRSSNGSDGPEYRCGFGPYITLYHDRRPNLEVYREQLARIGCMPVLPPIKGPILSMPDFPEIRIYDR
jgi:hypothetical protein